MEKTTMITSDPREAGFSMVELLVAMVMTLMVSGAIFGLLTGGQNAFRREPEMTDRQQNIRIAMDLIKRDVAGAGAGMVPFVQAFTNGLNAAGGNPTNGSGGQTLGVIDSPPTATDILEILTASGDCLPTTTTALTTATPGTIVSPDRLPGCYPDSAATANRFFYLGSPSAGERDAYGVFLGKATALSGASNFTINVTNLSGANLNPTAGPSAGFCNEIGSSNFTSTCTVLMPIDVVRYQVAPDPDDPMLPALWRSRTGVYTPAGGSATTPGVGNGTWEVVARGIEDLQVKYFRGGSWQNTPGDIYCDAPCNSGTSPAVGDFNRIVRQVRVTLSARATGKTRIQGSTSVNALSGARNAIRGQLMAEMTPRAALTALTTNVSIPAWY
jgi:type II secretory pathway pseudopilin PulG